MQLWTRGMRSSLATSSQKPFHQSICFQCWRKITSGTFREGDIVLLRPKRDGNATGILSRPLRAGRNIQTPRGAVPHHSIIGKRVRDLVSSSIPAEFRIHEPTLSEYVRLTPRIVTPLLMLAEQSQIYPPDANLIVSLLDLHVSPPDEGESEANRLDPLEILEAGTGHGGLTLHLARAIHAANPQLPARPRMNTSDGTTSNGDGDDQAIHTYRELIKKWKERRNAVVHTLDVSARHSQHAEAIVKGFRRGLYAGNVDFHVADVSDWIQSQFQKRSTASPFLSHILLDLPSAELHLEAVARALKVDGTLTLFNPSVTQIADALHVVKKKKLPLWLDQVIEFGQGISAGRQWDLRAVKPRALQKAQQQAIEMPGADEMVNNGAAPADVAATSDMSTTYSALAPDKEIDDSWTLVCRPKVGDRVIGGGFLGAWKRTREDTESHIL